MRNLLFTIVVPGSGAIWIPWWLLTRDGAALMPRAWAGLIPIAAGLALYFWCLWLFASVGRGTPGPWDAPRRFVAGGPYRWVRNPIYVGVFLVIAGEAWLFMAPVLLMYLVILMLAFHLFIVGYEEPTLRHSFGETYLQYLRSVPRWIPRPPRHD